MAGAAEKRSFGLSAEDISALAEQYKASKRLPNPYRLGAYKFVIDALLSLGTNKFHPLAKVNQAFHKAAGDEWYAAWANKEKRSADAGKDADERFIQNLRVLQRTKDYGRKLLQVGQKVLKRKGAVIDLRRDKDGGLLVALNTNSAKPLKPGRVGAKDVRGKVVSRPKKGRDATRAQKGDRRAAPERGFLLGAAGSSTGE